MLAHFEDFKVLTGVLENSDATETIFSVWLIFFSSLWSELSKLPLSLLMHSTMCHICTVAVKLVAVKDL